MTSYEDDNLPYALEAEAMPAEMFVNVQAAFMQALESGQVLNSEAKAVHVYNRKGYLEADSFVGPQNPSYRHETDDVILQMTIRIPNPKTVFGKSMGEVTALEERAIEYATEAARKLLEAEIAQAESIAAQAESAARAARERLEALHKR